DAPSMSGATSHKVFEGGLPSLLDPYGTGNHLSSASFPITAIGPLGVHFGADGPAAQTTKTETIAINSTADEAAFNNGNGRVGDLQFSQTSAVSNQTSTAFALAGSQGFIGILPEAGPITLGSIDL